jgi:hypothetical protein
MPLQVSRAAAYVNEQLALTSERPAAKPTVLTVAPGIAMLDLDAQGNPLSATYGHVMDPVMSGDGNHVIWQYDADHANYYGHYGFIWRNLNTGRTIIQPEVWPYGSDLSANGRYVVYGAAAQTASSGLVTGMNVWLWDTSTGQRTIINRTPTGKIADDGQLRGLHISANSQYVVFASSSQELEPPSYKMCKSCFEGSSYVYLYDRLTNTLRSLPEQAAFGGAPFLGYPVISSDGGIVVFHDGRNVDVWSTTTNKVWQVTFPNYVGAGGGDSLAVSGNGRVVANVVYGVGVIKLGPSPGTYQQEYYFREAGGEFSSVALSGNGNVLAFFGDQGEPGWGHWPLWRVELPSGSMELLRPPPVVPALRLQPTGSGISEQVSISANGEEIAALACSIQLPSASDQPEGKGCALRSDVYRWNAAAVVVSVPSGNSTTTTTNT